MLDREIRENIEFQGKELRDIIEHHDLFVYSNSRGFYGDKRFAKPTHWLEIPELPKVNMKNE
jgi:hypothetical protein